MSWTISLINYISVQNRIKSPYLFKSTLRASNICYKAKCEKSRFVSKLFISCRDPKRERMKPSSDFCPQATFAASVTSFACLSTACVWQGNFVKLTVGVTSVVKRSLNAASVIALITEAPR